MSKTSDHDSRRLPPVRLSSIEGDRAYLGATGAVGMVGRVVLIRRSSDHALRTP